MSDKKFEYTGRDNLEAMTEAKKYNSYLIDIVEQGIKSSGKKNPKILDFGAGSGTYADMLRQRGVGVDCLEPDAILQKTLKKKGYQVKSNAQTLKPNSYDVIYALNVLEHVDDQEEVIAQLSASLKKGGVLVIYVPAFMVLYSSMDKLVGHFRRYRTNHLNNLAASNKLKVIKLNYCDPLGFFAALVYRMFGNKEGRISMGSVKLYDKYVFPLSSFAEPITKKMFGKNVVLMARK